MLIPAHNYLLLKKLERDTGVVTDTDIEDTHQRYEILAVNPTWCGWYESGTLHTAPYKPGQIVYVQKHADADNPKELKNLDQALIQASRVMAVEEAE